MSSDSSRNSEFIRLFSMIFALVVFVFFGVDQFQFKKIIDRKMLGPKCLVLIC